MIFSVFLDIICLIKCHKKTSFTQEIDRVQGNLILPK